ncbi:phosphoglycerate kinase [Campylobacter sp. RM9344]|uniref:Phosphoglycerate kinase n=1 Tax=Campylobacter californiensis TaxID=1032243 RepID=A0AAW3ZQG7_9BACT|nr:MULTISPECIES: phosphoglycerate kinase [unclassified Campylobacter]MBE2984437.1 phosphoglycerate kinase [Campylobacter sp. RM6883]MBE2985775.1 phosphoglycerate kinase [Campylobacter sp. RM12919]MBE2987890.1 phosphoglycerate kinase [Campylobacter sp. RM12920]MBE2995033.1 phosphoglycerate kinase [Campylobacter sp. RM6913]MBE3021823.1 phosphoglycerate kinase [Campylobacter sp. 7477a]MBE3028876.1 phosphoglycerate kinase [Campylobacter sp. RM9344]
MHGIISVKDINLANKSVFIRCDFNVPMDEFGNITDDRRIFTALPTIKYCLDQGCKIVLASHLGRPKNGYEEAFSLKPVAKRLSFLLHQEVKMATDVIGPDAKEKAKNLKQGEILLLENLRFEKGETKNDENLARELSGFGEVYVNDAFGVCHRAHASVEAVVKFYDENTKAAGFLLQKEIEFAEKLIKKPARPFVAVVGGSKVSGKLQALKNLLPRVDKLIIGGGMAFTFLKAMGENIGNSLLEEELVEEALMVLKKGKELGVKIYLPVDVVAAQSFSNDSAVKFVTAQEIPAGWMGLDIGPASIRLFQEAIIDAQTIWWNGPMGVFEMDKFSKGSIKMSHSIAETHATTVVGGGDTADVVARAGDADEMTFISTGGGASLELIEGKELPGVKPLRRSGVEQ